MAFTDSITPPSSIPENSSGARGSNIFQSPWLDYATLAVPDTHQMVMWWSQYLWITDGNYSTAMRRVAAHFLTALDFPDLQASEENTWRDFFADKQDYRAELMSCADDYLCYGNLIISLYIPFKRMLVCTNCGLERAISEVDYTLEFTPHEPYLKWNRAKKCPGCGDHSPYKLIDRRDANLEKVVLNKYDPRSIELAVNRFSRNADIFWKPSAEDIQDVNSKARIHIDDTPEEVLQTVASGGVFKFGRGMVLHIAEPTLSGIKTRGWGLPMSMPNFRTFWLNQIYNRTSQAIAMDYTLGIRTWSPDVKDGANMSDPMQSHNMDEFVAFVEKIVKDHRNNPVHQHACPYPMKYQFSGGEGAGLLPPDLLKFRQQELLSQLGVPLEYHNMNLSTQAAPMSLRLFEAYWQAIPAFYNRILNWIVTTLSRTFDLESTSVVMQKTTYIDDMQRKNDLLQLMSAGEVSPKTALGPFGVDAYKEVDNVIKHREYLDKKQRESDERAAKSQEMAILGTMVSNPTPSSMLAQQQQAGGQPGAAPAGGSMGVMPSMNSTPRSLNEVSEQAMAMAQQLVGMEEVSRKQQLRSIRESNKDLHALVVQNMEEIRSQAATQGGAMLLQQSGSQQ